MSIFSEISELSPKLIKYPIEKIIKAFVNIALDRKVPSSICRILAAIIGITIGILLPQISELALLLSYITLDINLSYASTITISTIISAWVCCSACIYIAKAAFQSYYFHKYGDTNPEHRLTESDKRYIYNNNIDKTDEEINKLISTIEKRISLIVVELQKLKIKENENAIKHIKLVLNRLKKGDLEFFDEYYDEGITTDTRQKKRYDYNSRSANVNQNSSNSIRPTDDLDLSSTLLPTFNAYSTKKDCQKTCSFDILAVNKNKI